MSNPIASYQQITEQLSQYQCAEEVFHNTLILPVSKRKPSSDIRALYEVGVHHFAENYLQEAQQKMQELSDCSEIQWHYIGKIQSKKCKCLAKQMDWVHTVDDVKQAALLDKYCVQGDESRLKPLNICIQVNLHQEEQKNGIAPSELLSVVTQVATFPHLILRGLMLIGQFGLSVQEQIESFREMRRLFQICQRRLKIIENGEQTAESFDTLSMGMSSDWQNAVKEGSTMIRLGTTIFGERD